jgi:hypothetical protein
MRPWQIGLFVLWALISATFIPVFAGESSIYLSFLGDEVVDYPAVRVNIGRPEQTVKLRVIFTPTVCPLCEAGVTIALFDSTRTLKHRSSTYETIVPTLVGRDIVNLAGVHTHLLIGFVDAHASDTIDGIEGYFYIMHGDPWTSATIDRHGLRLTFSLSTTTDLNNDPIESSNNDIDKEDYVPLEPIPWGRETAVDALASHFNSNGASALARVTSVQSYQSKGNYTVLIAPDLDVTFVPLALFQRYFADKSFYKHGYGNSGSTNAQQQQQRQPDPTLWRPFTLSLVMPLMSSALFTDESSHNSVTRPLIIEGRSILPLLEGTDAVDFDRLEHSAVALSGSDTIKMLPHNIDNNTIILGGHMLWASAFLHIVFTHKHHSSSVSATPHIVLLVPHQTAASFTVGHALIFLVVCLAYIRWKMSRQLYDGYTEKKHRIRFDFVVYLESDSLLWPILLPIWFAPLIVLARFDTLQQQPATILTDSQLVRVMLTGLVSWVALVFLVATFDVLNIIKAVKSSWHEFDTHIRPSPWRWFLQTYFPTPAKKAPAVAVTKSKSSSEPESPVLAPWRKQFENYLSSYLMRDVLADTVLAIAAWAFFIPLESRVFALPVLFVILTVNVYNNLYHFFILFFTMGWPMVAGRKRSGRFMRRTYPRSFDVIALFLILLTAINNGVLLVQTTLTPLIENFSSVYGAGEESGTVVVALFVMTTLFIAMLMADMGIQTQTLRGDDVPPNLVPLDTLRYYEQQQQQHTNDTDSKGKHTPATAVVVASTRALLELTQQNYQQTAGSDTIIYEDNRTLIDLYQ